MDERSQQDNKKVMDLFTVIDMFHKLSERLDGIENKRNEPLRHSPTQLTSSPKQHFSTIPAKTNQPGISEVSKIKEELEYYKHENTVMSKTIQRMHDSMNDLASQVESLEIINYRKYATLTAFDISTDKFEAISQVEVFFTDVYGFKPGIDDVFTIGSASPSTIVIVFQTLQDKSLIMANKSVLKDYKGRDGRERYFNDYWPAALNEKKRQKREFLTSLENAGVNFKTERGEIKIDGQKIPAPSQSP